MNLVEFCKYHGENPEVYNKFEEFTFQAIKSGRKYFSARAVIERMRWQSMIEDNTEEFKISDHPMPYYARMFEILNPQHKGFFRKKRCEADKLMEDILK